MHNPQLITRAELLKIVRSSFPRSNIVKIAHKLLGLIHRVEELKRNSNKVYNAKARLVDQVSLGEYWKDQGRQRRRIKRTFPSRSRGRPRPLWPRYLIAKLGEEYIRQTGRLPKRGAAGGALSPFERFAAPILFAFEIDDIQGLVREYRKELEKQNPVGFGQV